MSHGTLVAMGQVMGSQINSLELHDGTVWYCRRRPCGVAINTLVDLINWQRNPQVCAVDHDAKRILRAGEGIQGARASAKKTGRTLCGGTGSRFQTPLETPRRRLVTRRARCHS